MKVVLLMCLLHATLPFSASFWPQSTDPTITNACLTDKGSCRCCLMVQNVNRLAMYFNTTLNDIQEEYQETKQVLYKITESRTAFSVALRDARCIGPFPVNTIIVYKEVYLNLGLAYNEDTGIFTVPRSGVYSLTVTVYSDAGAPGTTLVACANLLVNGQVVAGPRDINRADHEDSATINVAHLLTAGEEVAVSLPAGCFLCEDGSHYNTFSAFLLYTTEEAEPI